MKYLDTDQAAAYLGFKTRAGIRHCVYRGELVPDGRGYRGGYVFTTETLDGWVKTRQERIDGIRRRNQITGLGSLGDPGEAGGEANGPDGQPQVDGRGLEGRRAQGTRRAARRNRVNHADSPADSLARIRDIVAGATKR